MFFVDWHGSMKLNEASTFGFPWNLIKGESIIKYSFCDPCQHKWNVNIKSVLMY